MPLIAIRCENCGGELRVDSDSKSYFCHYCNTPYTLQESVVQHITNNTTTIGHVENLIDDGSGKIDQEIFGAEQQLRFKQYATALERFENLTYIYAHKYRAWWGLIRAKTENFAREPVCKSEFDEICDLFKKLLLFEEAPENEKSVWKQSYEAYFIKGQTYADQLNQERTTRLSALMVQEENDLRPYRERYAGINAKFAKQKRSIRTVEKIVKIIPFVVAGIVLIALVASMLGVGDMSGRDMFMSLLSAALVYGVARVIMWALSLPVLGVMRGIADNMENKLGALQKDINIVTDNYNSEKNAVIAVTNWLDR